ncbi:MAG TPA: MarR family transcriptional regulator [Solirubrobacteraceae bacterium]|nr:MarR family transcriptional regulator [Solirubrobacteraceae bacterium]
MSDASGTGGLHDALVRNTGYLVSRMGTFAARRFGERLAELGLTTRMWGALNVLDAEGEITQQQLGRAIGMDPSSMVATLDELEARGMVQRRRHPSDRRAHALHLTAAGRDTLARGRQLSAQAQEELLAPLSAEERARLHELLLRMATAAGQVAPGPPPAAATRRVMSAPSPPTDAG